MLDRSVPRETTGDGYADRQGRQFEGLVDRRSCRSARVPRETFNAAPPDPSASVGRQRFDPMPLRSDAASIRCRFDPMPLRVGGPAA